MDDEKNLNALRADYGKCYTIGNYMLCPDHKVISVGKMFGNVVGDGYGYFPDSTLQYDKETMVIFAGQAFIDESNLNIDWQNVQLLHMYRKDYAQFTDGVFLYELSNGVARKLGEYDSNKYKPHTTSNPTRNQQNKVELGERFYIEKGGFYYQNHPILEPFDVVNLRAISSKSGYESNFATDGKQVIFCGPASGYRITKKNGKDYVVVKELIIENVDLATLRVLGKDLLVDKNCLYYRTNVIPFDKLNGFKFNIIELD